MVGVYEIRNKVNSSVSPYNEILLLKTIKALQGRNKDLQDHYINIWEELNNKKFDKNLLVF